MSSLSSQINKIFRLHSEPTLVSSPVSFVSVTTLRLDHLWSICVTLDVCIWPSTPLDPWSRKSVLCVAICVQLCLRAPILPPPLWYFGPRYDYVMSDVSLPLVVVVVFFTVWNVLVWKYSHSRCLEIFVARFWSIPISLSCFIHSFFITARLWHILIFCYRSYNLVQINGKRLGSVEQVECR